MKLETLKIDNLLRKRFFILPSSLIYGSASGLYDFGPLGTLLKQNIITTWREHFITNTTYEIEPCILTPHDVFKASGHVDKFTDLLIFDLVNGECYRADHFLEKQLASSNEQSCTDNKFSATLNRDTEVERINILQNLEKLTPQDVNDICQKYKLKSESGNDVGNCKHFNLMFATNIGPKKAIVAYLRPETAQGHFVNFKKIYEINNGKLPFASACVGKVFRNEISPRSGLLRVREFEQAEIEYFTYPDEKEIKEFKDVEFLEVSLLFSENDGEQKIKIMTLKDAVENKIIDNEVLGYFIGKTFLFLKNIGINLEKLRFRQHKKDEMAHYANDCWDAEIETSYGWVECVGIADRGCFDLSMHQKFSGKDLTAKRNLKEPLEKEVYKIIINKKEIASKLKDKMKNFMEQINQMTQHEIEKLINEYNFDSNNKIITDTKHNESINNASNNSNELNILVNFERENYTFVVKKERILIHIEEILPHVIEPSFGIGRIFYALLEHCYYVRENDLDGNVIKTYTKLNEPERNVLKFNPKVAPIRCIITTLIKGDEFNLLVDELKKKFEENKLKFIFCDRNVSIGKKYASYDEIGVPYFVTIDKQSLEDGNCTIRERDSMKQIRVHLCNTADIIKKLIEGDVEWKNLKSEPSIK
ncbi:hypothetical protein COBT_002691 [Conglomerata obtusa]